MSQWRIETGDVRERLAMLPGASVQTCVTSPPYWGLRDYGHAGQIGLEATPEAYTASLVEVFAAVRRVLKDDGTVWLNLGDSYNSGTQFNHHSSGLGEADRYAEGTRGDWPGHRAKILGLKSKDLIGIPWRVAFALQADGWYLRSDIIWSKPNPMPESVRDRPTKAHEYLFLLSKRERYYYDADDICEPHAETDRPQSDKRRAQRMGREVASVDGRGQSSKGIDSGTVSGSHTMKTNPAGRNKRSVWTVATQPYPEAHFATFPEALIEPCILAGSKVGDTVLDPFCGSGTTGAVAIRRQRDFIGIELNAAYVQLARQRIGAVAPLFSAEHTA